MGALALVAILLAVTGYHFAFGTGKGRRGGISAERRDGATTRGPVLAGCGCW